MPAGLWDGMMAALIGGIVGAIAGGLTSWGVSHVVAKKARRDNKVDQVESMAESLREEAIAYWRTNGRNASQERLIVTKLESLASKIDLMYARKHLSKDDHEAAEMIWSTLHEVATGGTFETITRVADPKRVERVRELCDGICRAVDPS